MPSEAQEFLLMMTKNSIAVKLKVNYKVTTIMFELKMSLVLKINKMARRQMSLRTESLPMISDRVPSVTAIFCQL